MEKEGTKLQGECTAGKRGALNRTEERTTEKDKEEGETSGREGRKMLPGVSRKQPDLEKKTIPRGGGGSAKRRVNLGQRAEETDKAHLKKGPSTTLDKLTGR